MMGPFHASSAPSSVNGKDSTLGVDESSEWDPMVLDLAKRDVLKVHILPTVATNRALQRVVTKYQVMLSEIDSREKDDEDEDVSYEDSACLAGCVSRSLAE
ncbi:hypothetical protein DD238_004848 [Peronospora effusa]|uniref:Uncharacterized protein n=1 Tax=Peronospora effusa TaxID=542832 RepID=A0A3M6VCL8_9STRA|nr:hypothetical protein DD238_004848 [Peronospora effusa]